jgi:hypothetical protein
MKVIQRGITIKPFGGLANRMRAIDSAHTLARKFNIPLEIVWEMSFELNCSFSKLFLIQSSISVVEYKITGFRKRISDSSIRYLRKFGIHFPLGYTKYLYDDEVLRLNRQHYDYEGLKSFPAIYINTVNRFYYDEFALKSFIPIPELQKKISDCTLNFNEHTIGIHIRRSDNIQSITHSPIEDFIYLMKKESELNQDTLFYLATDSPTDEKVLMEAFPGRIISLTKTLDRNSEKGIQDALVDLYCLSKTVKIFGSYYSSFSEVAAQINKIELIQIYKE